ncbi:hypothetical protein F8A86_09135 [Betaproteobacteria bacterium SCN1]|jgi:hypothetical protein|nr:hypothetical protein F8A86_09135 [Betaproteobacteria bacterium SCN1]MBN8760980.1 hypothetical protein [Thiobacillus sp.]ODU90539.1 MAG: hypothetical protein ABT21_00345 [Thiobacillus sp. SCN 65-179]OJW36036.1 MAG: hypothetical protein BGO61_08855 [Thiobacillus sp. 65-69]
MTLLWLLPAGLACLWAGVFAAFARPLAARWREPVLKHPVLAIESDDWGAGPLAQADLLGRVAACLQRVRDVAGRPAVMTLGVVMEVPDGASIAAGGGARYCGMTLADPRFEAIRAALRTGIEAGVFVPQLHGQCHYWPDTVMAVAARDTAVRDWLVSPDPARTEALPSPVQSRWVDAASLPSTPLADTAILQAVTTEAETFRALFGASPGVAVATTFVWNDTVEAAWRTAGVEAVITPGRRATCRDAQGRPACADRTMLTGEISPAGPLYLVRDVYFEPALGHDARRLADGVAERARQGRACLAETHRFNFLDAPDASLATLEAGLNAARARCADLRFLSPQELARAIRQRDPAWIDTRFGARMRAWRARLAEIPRFARAARLAGLGWVLA